MTDKIKGKRKRGKPKEKYLNKLAKWHGKKGHASEVIENKVRKRSIISNAIRQMHACEIIWEKL